MSTLVLNVGESYLLDLSKDPNNHTAKSGANLATGQPSTLTVTIDSSNSKLVSITSSQMGFSSFTLKLEVKSSEQAFFTDPQSIDMPISILVY
jgi:hypothetical protein